MNKKGFTLIELLAVIVILAIIALIATPIVMNVIDNAQKGADARSVEGYMKAVEAAYYQEYALNPGVEPTTADAIDAADYNGATVTCTDVEIADSKFSATCTVNDNTFTYENGKAEIVEAGA